MKKKKKSKLKILLIVLVILIVTVGAVLYFVFINIENKELGYSVKYLVDGEVYKEEVVDRNNAPDLDAVGDLEKDGYIFDGWYIGDEKYDGTTKLKEDTTLEAKWKEIDTAVTFDDGNGNIVKVAVKKNEKVSAIANPTRSNYKFVGWYYKNEPFDFNTAITESITLVAKWEKVNTKEGVNTNDYIKTYINNKIVFSTNFNENKQTITVNIEGVNNNLNKTVLSIIETTKKTIIRDDISKIVINYNGNSYTISDDDCEEVLTKLFTDLTDTSSLSYSNRHLSSLYNKNITVEFILNTKNFYSKLASTTYKINFTSKKVVTKSYMDNNSYKSVDYIKVYDVSFNTNHNIYCKFSSSYNNQTIADVLSKNSHDEGGSGTGLNDALTNFASNPHLAKLVIKLPDGSTTELTRKQLLNVKNGGLSLIRFAKAIIKGLGISGSLTSAKHSSFDGKTLTFKVTLLDGYAFEDGFNNEYRIIISSK